MRSNHQTRYQPLQVSENARRVDSITENQSKWRLIWQTINGVMVVFFLLCAFVQLNDPDPYLWIPVYMIPAMLCAALVWSPDCVDNSYWKILCTVHIACCVLGAMYLLAIVIEMLSGNLHNPLVYEEGRELAGLIITVLWLLVTRFAGFGSVDGYRSVRNGLLLVTVVLGLMPLLMWSLCFVEVLEKSLAHCTEMFPGMLGAARATQ